MMRELTQEQEDRFDGYPMDCIIEELLQAEETVQKQAAEIADLREKIADQAAKIERLKKFITDAPCPYCNGSGGFQISEDEAEQCRWCYEKEAALKAAKKAGER